MRILIVDDSPVIRTELKIILSSSGYQDLVFAESASEAFRYIEMCGPEGGSERIDLILMDIMMPEVNGIEACRRIKGTEGCRDTPIIMMTADEGAECLQSAFDACATDFLRKPLNKVELLARLRSALRLKSETECRKAREKELVELNELKNRFLGIAAHDLRNPLQAISLSSELLLKNLEQLTAGKVKKTIEMINTATSGMSALVDDLLDVSIIEGGRLELQPQKGSLKGLIENRISIMRIIAERKNIAIHSAYSDIAPLPFDRNRISQVIDNLLSNAIKYSPAGSNIYVSLAPNGNYGEVDVKDEGPGIRPDEQDRLFGEFQKLGTKPTGGEKSTGLGLAIVKKIVKAHGGDVWVKSSPGKGAIFGFTLPFEKPLA